jgi:hypothetical protein
MICHRQKDATGNQSAMNPLRHIGNFFFSFEVLQGVVARKDHGIWIRKAQFDHIAVEKPYPLSQFKGHGA